MPFTIYDLGAIGIILVMGAFMAIWGLVGLISGIGAWIGAGASALFLYPHLQGLTNQWVGQGLIGDLSAAAGGFAVSLVVLMVIGSLISNRVKASALGPANRALGFAVGLATGFSVISLLMVSALLLMGDEGLPRPLKDSRSYSLFIHSGMGLMQLVPDQIKSDSLVGLQKQQEQTKDALDAYRLYQNYVNPKTEAESDNITNGLNAGGSAKNNLDSAKEGGAELPSEGYTEKDRSLLDTIILKSQE